jgi:uncharacterized protein (TIGR03435 family)
VRQALLIIALLVPVLEVRAQDAPNALTFEVASVKVRTTAGAGSPSGPDRYAQTNASLRDLVADAYHVQRYEVVGGPTWFTGSVRFDVVAKASFVPSPEQMRLMLQRLLAERFMLRVHREMREMPIYVLHLARTDGRLGTKLKRTTVDCVAIHADRQRRGERAPLPLRAEDQPACGSFQRGMPGPSGITLRYQASGLTLRELAAWLSPYVGRPVIDRTNLLGDFDLDLAFHPGEVALSPSPVDEPVLVFTALQEQLGLKLESSREPVDVLVVDSAQLPMPD